MPGHRARFANPDLVACLCFGAMLGLLVWNRATFDIWVARHDNLTAYLPWWSYLGERLRAGQIPGWNPHQFSGIPFLADPQSGWMHLPTMLAFTLFDPDTAMKVKATLEFSIAGYGAYALARLLGYRPMAAVTGAAVFTFGPLSLQAAYCCTVRLHIATWLPLALLGPEIAIRALGRTPARPYADPAFLAGIGIGAFAYSQMLAGWMGQGTYDAALVVGGWCLYRALTVRTIGNRWRRGATGVGSAVCVGVGGAALNAAALLPRIAFNPETHLGAGNYDRIGGYYYDPYNVKDLLTTLLDDDYRHRGFTIPAAAILLLLLAVAIAPRAHPLPFFAGLTLIVYSLTLNWGPAYWLLSLLPRWQELHDHYPQQAGAVVMIGPTMLAAAAVDALPGLRHLSYRVARIGIPLGLIAAAMIWIALTQDGNRPLLVPLIVLVITALLVIVIATITFTRARITVLLGLLGLLTFVDPMGLEVIDAETGSRIIAGWDQFWDPDPKLAAAVTISLSPHDPKGAGDFLQQQMAREGPFRYVGYGGSGYPGDRAGKRLYTKRRAERQIQAILVNGRAIFLDLYDIQGYNPTQLDRYVGYITAMNGKASDYHLAELRHGGVGSPLLDMLNVRYILIDTRLPRDRDDVVGLTQGQQPVFENKYVRVYENPGAFPHAWIVHDLRHVTRAQAAALLQERAVDFSQVALVEDRSPAVGQPPTSTVESATVTRYEPERIEIDVTAGADGFLVVSDTYAKGWQATIDGKSVNILPTNLVLRGIPVSAGQQTVVLTFTPPWFRPGLVISILSHLALLATLIWWPIALRNAPDPDQTPAS